MTINQAAIALQEVRDGRGLHVPEGEAMSRWICDECSGNLVLCEECGTLRCSECGALTASCGEGWGAEPKEPSKRFVKVRDVETMPWPGPDGPADPDDLWEVLEESDELVTLKWTEQPGTLLFRRLHVDGAVATVPRGQTREP